MNSAISNILGSGTILAQVQLITGDANAATSAAGYAAFVQAITGVAPSIEDMGNKKAKMVLTPTQKNAMMAWLDSQVKGVVSLPSAPPAIDLAIGDYLTPWMLKYMGPALIGAFVLGWLAKWMIK